MVQRSTRHPREKPPRGAFPPRSASGRPLKTAGTTAGDDGTDAPGPCTAARTTAGDAPGPYHFARAIRGLVNLPMPTRNSWMHPTVECILSVTRSL